MCSHSDTIIELCEFVHFLNNIVYFSSKVAEHNHNFFTVLLKDRLEKNR